MMKKNNDIRCMLWKTCKGTQSNGCLHKEPHKDDYHCTHFQCLFMKEVGVEGVICKPIISPYIIDVDELFEEIEL